MPSTNITEAQMIKSFPMGYKNVIRIGYFKLIVLLTEQINVFKILVKYNLKANQFIIS